MAGHPEEGMKVLVVSGYIRHIDGHLEEEKDYTRRGARGCTKGRQPSA